MMEQQRKPMNSRLLSEILLEEAVISREQLRAALNFRQRDGAQDSANDAEISLGDALVQIGALSAQQLKSYLDAYQRKEAAPIDEVNAPLLDRPNGEVLEVIANQLMRSLMSTLGGRVTAEGWHSEIDKVEPCEYTIYQAFTGDFEGEVYLNLSASMMLQIASTQAVKDATSVSVLVADGVCEFIDFVNMKVCSQLRGMGVKVGLKQPLFFRHPYWGERVGAPFDFAGRIGDASFTSVALSHPVGRQELCLVDRTRRHQ